MNRYPLWVYVTIAVALVLGALYTLPNFFGEAPAVQVSPARATLKVDSTVLGRVEEALKKAGIQPTGISRDLASIKVRLSDTDTQLKAKDLIERTLNPDAANPSYTVALNLLPNSPRWLAAVKAQPMYLGLDLRGGVHFLLQVDMRAAIAKRAEGLAGDMRSQLRDKNVRHAGISREGDSVVIRFRDAETRDKARAIIAEQLPDLQLADASMGSELRLVATIRPEAQKRTQALALKQNIQTLHNRINELGVAEPVIQQQGSDRVVVQLPGVQDTAKAKEILGRTATLEVRMVDEDNMNAGALAAAQAGQVPFGDEFYVERNNQPLLVRKQVVLTGDRLTDAQPGFDNQTQEPAVHLTLDATGARIFREYTRENVGKRMAILLIEKGKGEVVTAPVIRSEIGGGRVQISGRMTTVEANDIALLLRAGALAAPMEIVEERTVGPSLGADNIKKGFDSTIYGFAALSLFIIVYYSLFGVFSALALCANLLFLIALLSMLQATLTLPGIAAIALTLGMAIDANVLINERVREELRGGATPQAAIHAGYERAWATILDSNVTTLVVGLSLLMVPGAVRGFAVVHCLGIGTSMFSAVVVSRAIVNLVYVHRCRVLPGVQGPQLLGRVHRRHADRGRLPALGRRRPHPHDARRRRLQGRGAELRLLARGADPHAPAEEPVERRPFAESHRDPEEGRQRRRAEAGGIRRAAGRLRARQSRLRRPAGNRGVVRALSLDALRVALRPFGHRRQPARRGDHPGLLRLLPVGVFAAGARRGASRARLLGQRVGGGVRPGAGKLQEDAQGDHRAGDRQRDHRGDLAHHHHAPLHADDGHHDAALRLPGAALLCARPHHRHLLRHLLLVARREPPGHVARRQARPVREAAQAQRRAR